MDSNTLAGAAFVFLLLCFSGFIIPIIMIAACVAIVMAIINFIGGL